MSTKSMGPVLLLLAWGASCSGEDPASDDSTASGASTSDSSVADSSSSSSPSADSTTTQSSGADSTTAGCSVVGEGPQPGQFLAGSLISDITEEPCTLADGTQTMCYRIEIAGEPSNHDVGPYCPRSIDDGPDDVGLWPDSGVLHDVDGAFVTDLATFYNDDTWQLYDPVTGDVNVTDTQEACLAAAMPNAPEEYLNYCVECTIADVGGPVSDAYLIPIEPVASDTPTEIEEIPPGVSLNGVRIEFPANTEIILAAYNIAPLDDCGGHVNNGIGYHYHESTGCVAGVEQCDGHAPLMGYAQDGYAIHEMAAEGGEEPADLDECRGHTDDLRGYHYHAASGGENMFIGCFRGVLVEGVGGGPGGGGPPGGGAPGGG
ncbi:MAG: YHYH protein [Deltaproteobacteria bacterium]|nr:YHYH protein [Deltaproteobacteria bacterium]